MRAATAANWMVNLHPLVITFILTNYDYLGHKDFQ